MLKPDEAYFDFGSERRRFGSCNIKLKKEYIGQFGDVGDFAVVGARYEAAKARQYAAAGLTGGSWTHFFVGCLENREEVWCWGRKPRFVVTNVVELNAAQMKSFMLYCRPESVPAGLQGEAAIEVRVEKGIDRGKGPSELFTKPPVFDLRCCAFHK